MYYIQNGGTLQWQKVGLGSLQWRLCKEVMSNDSVYFLFNNVFSFSLCVCFHFHFIFISFINISFIHYIYIYLSFNIFMNFIFIKKVRRASVLTLSLRRSLSYGNLQISGLVSIWYGPPS